VVEVGVVALQPMQVVAVLVVIERRLVKLLTLVKN
jgi:hypothetical protein